MFFTLVLLLTSSFATVIVSGPPNLKANEIYFPIAKTGKQISLMDLSTISRGDLESLRGRKMNFLERLSFRAVQKKLKRNISGDGTIDNKKIEKLFAKKNGSTGFNGGGFALGFFLNGIGVVIAYLIDDEAQKNRAKWAWIGFGASVVMWVILYAALIAATSL